MERILPIHRVVKVREPVSPRVHLLAFKCKLAYSKGNKPSCAEPFWLIAYARENSKRLLFGLFLYLKQRPT
jgi:hypothetical protein